MGLISNANATANMRSQRELEKARVEAAHQTELLTQLLEEQRNTNRWLEHIAGMIAQHPPKG